MRAAPPRPAPITSSTRERLNRLFVDKDREQAEKLLINECGQNLPFCEDYYPDELDRLRFAALKLSDGNLNQLIDAINLAKTDWRDMLMAADFGHDTRAHLRWMPDRHTA